MSIRKQGLKVVLAFISCLGLAAMALADEDSGKGKGKGKGKSEALAPTPTVIQLDVSKLPPDLVKALLKYASSAPAPTAKATQPPSKGKEPAPMAKGKAPAPAPVAKGYMGGKQLPPGLAKKPPNHPGRTHYIQHVLGGIDPTRKGGLPAKGPGKGKGKDKGNEEED